MTGVSREMRSLAASRSSSPALASETSWICQGASAAGQAARRAVSRLLVYVATCASTLRLRDAAFRDRVNPPTFVVPFGPVIPSVAIVVALLLVAILTVLWLFAASRFLRADAWRP